MSLLLDTHAALWLVQGSPRLTDAVRDQVAGLERDEICISDMLLLELSVLIAKQRVRIRGDATPFLREFAARFRVLPVDADIASTAMSIDLPQGDPFDRVFVATALRHTLTLATRDRQIARSGLVPVVW